MELLALGLEATGVASGAYVYSDFPLKVLGVSLCIPVMWVLVMALATNDSDFMLIDRSREHLWKGNFFPLLPTELGSSDRSLLMDSYLEISRFLPSTSRKINIAPCVSQPRDKVHSFIPAIIKFNDETSSYVTERPQISKFDENCSIRISSQSDSCFKDHVKSRLWCIFRLICRFILFPILFPQASLVIRRHHDDKSLSGREDNVQYFAYIGRWFTCKRNCVRPF